MSSPPHSKIASTTKKTPRTAASSNTNTILQALQSGHTNADTTPPPKKPKYIQLTEEQFERIMSTCSKQQECIDRISSMHPTALQFKDTPMRSLPAYYSNAKYEEISCKGMKPAYDGTEDELIPFLTRLDIRRQHEGWAPATYVTIHSKTYDLTSKFAQVSEYDITEAAESRWNSENVQSEKHTVGHETYNSRLLAIVLFNSITEDFSTTLIHRVPMSLRNDGTYLLWSICHNIHRNNVAFTEHIREKISTAMLSTFNDDIIKYIIYIKHNL